MYLRKQAVNKRGKEISEHLLENYWSAQNEIIFSEHDKQEYESE